jgi:hypothetical protein
VFACEQRLLSAKKTQGRQEAQGDADERWDGLGNQLREGQFAAWRAGNLAQGCTPQEGSSKVLQYHRQR